jgi:flagellin
MALIVNSNLASLNALNNLNRTNGSLSDTFGRISSGLRINQAADDAAGLAVAENLDAQTRSLTVAKRNANDGISMIQVAEGATNEVANLLKRMRELAVQSSSETLASVERNYLVTEFDELKSEMDRIAVTTEFNGVGLTRGTASGSATNLSIQVGANNTTDDRITVALGDLQATALGLQSTAVSSVANAQTAIDNLDTALNTVNSQRATFGAAQNRLDSAVRSIETYTQNLTAAESQIRDADFAHEAAQMAKQQIMQQAGTAVLAQSNNLNAGVLRLLG